MKIVFDLIYRRLRFVTKQNHVKFVRVSLLSKRPPHQHTNLMKNIDITIGQVCYQQSAFSNGIGYLLIDFKRLASLVSIDFVTVQQNVAKHHLVITVDLIDDFFNHLIVIIAGISVEWHRDKNRSFLSIHLLFEKRHDLRNRQIFHTPPTTLDHIIQEVGLIPFVFIKCESNQCRCNRCVLIFALQIVSFMHQLIRLKQTTNKFFHKFICAVFVIFRERRLITTLIMSQPILKQVRYIFGDFRTTLFNLIEQCCIYVRQECKCTNALLIHIFTKNLLEQSGIKKLSDLTLFWVIRFFILLTQSIPCLPHKKVFSSA